MLLETAKGIFKAFQMINSRFDGKEAILVTVKSIAIPRPTRSKKRLLLLLTEKQVKLVRLNLTKIDAHLKPDFFSFL